MGMLRLGIDLHGVIDSDIDKFKNFLCASKNIGIEIWIISGPDKEYIHRELKEYFIINGLHYDEILSVVDYLKSKGVKMWTDEKGRWWASDEDWWSCKAEICMMHFVDIMIDDSERFGRYFENISTKFVLYKI